MAEEELGGQEEQIEETPRVSEEELREAKALGWAPKEQWRGDPEKWIDAKEFLDRGENVLPILKSNNQRLKDELAQRDRNVMQLAEQLRQSQAAIRALEDAHVEDAKSTATETIAEVQREIAEATRDGDYEAVGRLTDRLVDLKLQAKELEKPKGVSGGNGGGVNTAAQQEVASWMAANPRFTNPRLAALANGIATELRAKGDTRVGAAFLDDVAREVDAFLGEAPEAGGTKVSGGNGGRSRTGAASGGGKGFAELPADAKAACDKMAARFAGDGKKYKDQNSWRTAYARQYFAQEQ